MKKKTKNSDKRIYRIYILLAQHNVWVEVTIKLIRQTEVSALLTILAWRSWPISISHKILPVNWIIKHPKFFILKARQIFCQRRIQNPVKHLRWSFPKKLHLRCWTGIWIRLCFPSILETLESGLNTVP